MSCRESNQFYILFDNLNTIFPYICVTLSYDIRISPIFLHLLHVLYSTPHDHWYRTWTSIAVLRYYSPIPHITAIIPSDFFYPVKNYKYMKWECLDTQYIGIMRHIIVAKLFTLITYCSIPSIITGTGIRVSTIAIYTFRITNCYRKIQS